MGIGDFLRGVAGFFSGIVCFGIASIGHIISYESYSSLKETGIRKRSFSLRFRDWVLPYNPEAYWDKRGKSYLAEGRLRELPDSNRKLLYSAMLKAFDKISFSSLLEVGCGFGRNLGIISDSFSSKQLFGIDLSSEMISAAKSHLKSYPKIGVEKQDLKEMGFEEQGFDVVLSCETLLYVKKQDIKKAVNELIRVSRKYVVLVEPEISRIPFFQRLFHAKHVSFHNYENLFAETSKTELFYSSSIPYQFRTVYIFKKLKG